MEPIAEVVFDREYNAPLDAVWKAWTDPEELKQWWGPDNVTIDECSLDLKVGGHFYIVMVAGEAMGPYKGTRWPMEATFTTVEEKSKLEYSAKAWTEGAEDATTIEDTTAISFSEEGGKTKVHVHAAIIKRGEGAQMAVEGMKYGFAQQLDKLEKFLAR